MREKKEPKNHGQIAEQFLEHTESREELVFLRARVERPQKTWIV